MKNIQTRILFHLANHKTSMPKGTLHKFEVDLEMVSTRIRALKWKNDVS
ncbi:hypothetical protein L8106_27971 [Lyngbya sp. PCC 8106]|nr:hypothetical protein L8106_27971 [Lyngbya sp. PCC 8106]